MLVIKDLHFSYDSKHKVLSGISFEVKKGQLCAVFGPNGSGKSTLFKCIMGLLKPEMGNILINGNGRNVLSMKPEEIARTIAYIPQEHRPSFPYLVKEVVLMGRTPHIGIFGPKDKDIRKAVEAMKIIGITHLADRPYTDLSGGQRQLVLLARALAQGTEIMILDEPTSALDFRNQLRIWSILRKLLKSGKSIIVSIHDPNHMLWFCDKVVIIHKGMVLAEGDPREVLTEKILRILYGDVCSINVDDDGLKMVIPKINRF